MRNSTITKNIIISFFLFLSITICSCKKFVQIDPSPNLIESDKVFSSDQTAISAVSGLYVQMRLSNMSVTGGAMAFFPGLSADEINNTATNDSYDPFYTNSLLPDNDIIYTDFWQTAYTNIYRANAILEGIEESKSMTDLTRQQIKGEMEVIRSLNYFYLVNLFGDVPLITTTDYQANAMMSRTPSDLLYDQIISDLKDAESLLKASYPSNNKERPNKWTAAALLSRVYLYRNDWANAEAESSKVINAGIYSLAADLNNVFPINSTETIWQLGSDVSNTSEGLNFIPASSSVIPTFAVTDYLVNSFESGDQRKSAWLGKNTVSGTDYYYPYKYKNKNSSPITEYDVVLRLAEQYLISAEAKVEQDDLAGAQNDLNVIRNRAGLSNTTASDKTQLLNAIRHERQVELFCEWGNRWLDLKRTGQADGILGSIKAPNWQSTDTLYPIPLSQIQLDVNLTQNPGY